MSELPKKHHEFCEGHVHCPNTGKMECGKVVVSRVILIEIDGKEELIEEPATVYCFGCGQTHNVLEKAESNDSATNTQQYER